MRFRGRAVLAAVATVLVVAGCGDDGEAPTEPLNPPPTTDVTSTGEPEPTDDAGEDVAAITDVYQRYWDAVVTSENGPDDSIEPFEGIVSDLVLNEQIALVRGLAANELTREGAPELGDPEITVEGDTARLQDCVDEDDWETLRDGEALPSEDRGPQPRVFDLERVGGQWQIADLVPVAEATISC